MAKGTRKNRTAKKGGGLFDGITAYLPSWFKSKPSVEPGTANGTGTGNVPPVTVTETETPTYGAGSGGKKRKNTFKGGDGVTGHTQSGVATGAYKIGGRTRKQRKSRKSRRH